MKVLVTGGMGYLGSVLVDELLEQGFSLKILDSLTYGHTTDRISNELSIIRKDIRDDTSVQEVLDDVDAVVHLAAIVGEPASILDREDSIDINCFATRQLAKRCKDRGVKLVFASTCSVYEAKPDTLLNEGSEAYPLSLYASSKLAAEEAIMKYNSSRSTIFRLGTLFGYSRRMRFDLVVNRFVGQAIQDRKISVFGGSQYRPLVHVQDAAKAFISALTCPKTGTYNLGGVNYRILDIAKFVERKTGCRVTIHEELRDPRNYMVDSNLAMATFNARFATSIDDAVDEITNKFACGLIKDYRLPAYNNEECLRTTPKSLSLDFPTSSAAD
jgi:nucleoside-diphosphate-sugar epimerase